MAAPPAGSCSAMPRAHGTAASMPGRGRCFGWARFFRFARAGGASIHRAGNGRFCMRSRGDRHRPIGVGGSPPHESPSDLLAPPWRPRPWRSPGPADLSSVQRRRRSPTTASAASRRPTKAGHPGGGFDFAHKSGFTWALGVEHRQDAGGDANIEWTFYGGWKGDIVEGPAVRPGRADLPQLGPEQQARDNAETYAGARSLGPATAEVLAQ